MNMWYKYAFIAIMFLTGFTAVAQERFQVQQINNEWFIQHKVQNGETVFSLSRKYHVPTAMLADANGVTYQDILTAGTMFKIPLSAYNLVGNKQVNDNDKRELYLIADGSDNVFRIAHYAQVSQRQIRDWNKLSSNDLVSGQKLFVGWIMYDATEVAAPSKPKTPQKEKIQIVDNTRFPDRNSKVASKETVQPKRNNMDVTYKERKVNEYTTQVIIPLDTIISKENAYIPATKEEELYLMQTNDELNAVTEKGPAVFFDMKGKVGGQTLYAFHNAASRGSIIKVHNPGTGRTVYVKVLGPLPETGQYHNSIIGISELAKKTLGVSENKMWCELSYAGY